MLKKLKPKKQIQQAMIFEILQLRSLVNYLAVIVKDYKEDENKIALSEDAYNKIQEILEEVEENQDIDEDVNEWDFELEMQQNEVYVNSMEYNGSRGSNQDFMKSFLETFKIA